MCTAYLSGESITILVLIVLAVTLIGLEAKSGHRRKALEQRRERHESGRALLRYVQLNRQCSEAVAYQRLVTFVKQHVSLDDAGSIEWMQAHDKQILLAITQRLLVQCPDEIDKI